MFPRHGIISYLPTLAQPKREPVFPPNEAVPNYTELCVTLKMNSRKHKARKHSGNTAELLIMTGKPKKIQRIINNSNLKVNIVPFVSH